MNQFTIDEESQFEIQDLYQIEGSFTAESLKDHLQKLFDEAIQKYIDKQHIFQNYSNTLHIIWAKYNDGRNYDYLHLLQDRCSSFGLSFGLISFVDMQKINCVTKEAVEKHYQGRGILPAISVGEDLESFIQRIRLGECIRFETDSNTSFQFNLLSDFEEQKLENEDQKFLQSFQLASPDISAADMLVSKSKLKFAKFLYSRTTHLLAEKESPRIRSERSGSKNQAFQIRHAAFGKTKRKLFE